MAKSKKQLHEALRKKFLAHITEILTSEGEEVLLTKSNEISIPTLDEDGNEEFVVITFKVPTGSRDDGEAYDPYGGTAPADGEMLDGFDDFDAAPSDYAQGGEYGEGKRYEEEDMYFPPSFREYVLSIFASIFLRFLSIAFCLSSVLIMLIPSAIMIITIVVSTDVPP